MTGAGSGEPAPVPPHVAALCREYAALAARAAGADALPFGDFLRDVAALAVRVLPTARAARIRVRAPEVVTAVAARPDGATSEGVLAIPLVGRGDLAGVLELAPAGGGFPAHERELAEVLAVLLTLSLATGRAAQAG